MPAHHDEREFDYTTPQLFALVADIERYPEFLPWVKAVRIVERGENYYISDVIVHFKHISEQYRCKVLLSPPAGPEDAGEIHVELVKGPFHHLMNHWQFLPLPPVDTPPNSRIVFDVDFAFQSKLLDKLIGLLFARAVQKMVAAFSERADTLYGADDKNIA